MVAPAQVGLEGLGVVRAALGEPAALVARELRDERLGHLGRDVVFEVEDARELLVELAGPDGRALAHVEELRVDADGASEAADAPVEDEGDAQLPTGDDGV